MLPIQDVRGHDLLWTQPTIWRQHFELRHEAIPVASLTWHGAFGQARAETSIGEWTFEREGIFNPVTRIRRASASDPYATFRSGSNFGGDITLPDGQIFSLRHTDLYRTWYVATPHDIPVVVLTSLSSFASFRARVRVGETYLSDDDLALLLLLPAYHAIQIRQSS